MLQIFNSNKHALTKTIVAFTLLVAVSLTAGAQEQESDMDMADRKDKLASCFYRWDCFLPLDFDKETPVVQLIRFMCPEAEGGFGSVSLGRRKGSEQPALFYNHGLDYVWRFGDFESNNFTFVIKVDGSGLYYDFTNSKEDESTSPSHRFSCYERSDETTDRIIDIFKKSRSEEIKAYKSLKIPASSPPLLLVT